MDLSHECRRFPSTFEAFREISPELRGRLAGDAFSFRYILWISSDFGVLSFACIGLERANPHSDENFADERDFLFCFFLSFFYPVNIADIFMRISMQEYR